MGLFNNLFGKRLEKSDFDIEKIYRNKIICQQTMRDKPDGAVLQFGETTVEGKNYLLMYEQSEYSTLAEPNVGQTERQLKAYQYGAISAFDLQNGKQILKAEFRKEKDAETNVWSPDKEVGFNLVTKKGKHRIKAYSAKEGWQLFDGKDLYDYDKAERKVLKLPAQIAAKFRSAISENPQAHQLYLSAQKVIAGKNRQRKSIEQGR